MPYKSYNLTVIRIIDYPIVLERMKATGLVCNYYKGGSFGFPKDSNAQIAAWVGPDDPTIRPEMRPHIRQIAPPFAPSLSDLANRVWLELIGGPVWVIPASHWAFELDFGSR